MSFRYYLYVSDSKIDMLLAQMDPTVTRKRTTEVSLNLSILGGKHASETPAGGDRTARLSRVIRYLEQYGDLGTVDEPGQFFWGLMPMRWGPFPTEPTLVYFGGATERTVTGMGGSGNHVLGASPAAAPPIPRSLTPSLLAGLRTDPEIGALAEAIRNEDQAEQRGVVAAVRRANEVVPGPEQNLEFVAKRLLYEPAPTPGGRNVLLGSPLYVALVD
ncbi:DUF7019 family protein [Pseudonocardia charpentierae]|uniref:SAVMC3_10250 family protein n=1 Tax=Pseudonocardia charpentierae TaxID=3075545 RepID=A0ABU2N8G4_9PSEU|nr:SAVMC3_10250 family protein [Pseudonocardia sp. DSM 45834]MDT0350026.1 SAVMC3_10250 family protein [Pseudonocardia sp. DSM 45834]